MTKVFFYLFMFVLCLLAFTWSLFAISIFRVFGGTDFILLFALTFFSLGGSILFGYAFAAHAKELK